jgi:tetratricopeptide (TPR) repeat protein
MTRLELTEWEMPSARLDPPSPLPSLQPLRYVVDEISVDDSVPDHAREHLDYGCRTSTLPYGEQSRYGRRRRPERHRVAILENELLTAVFLLDLGGRLWSLRHRPSGRELLYVNDVFQPANLAIRNAWFSGGVEWNLSLRGHSPFTCSPLFASEYRGEQGDPVLRLFEYERVRGVPFAIDFSLPEGSEFLFARVHLVNPHDRTIPMYWWSNIAVPEQPGTRVLVPADHAYRYGYAGGLQRLPVPSIDDIDTSYPTEIAASTDYFYELREKQRPWIAAVDESGFGLVQTSTPRLTGRKMFVWGMCPGGRRWQRFLTDEGGPYLEIQAGLARTQYECLPMPPRATWSWVEAYGPVKSDPGRSWRSATEKLEAELERRLPAGALEARLAEKSPAFDEAPKRELNRASGWGALEAERRRRAGEFLPPIFDLFPADSIDGDQRPWLELLETGTFSSRRTDEYPGAWLVGAEWRERLAVALDNSWQAWLHLGVMAFGDGELEAAESAWHRSLEESPNPWAFRNLAVLKRMQGEDGCEQLAEAHRLHPEQLEIAIELAEAMLEAERATELLEWWKSLADRLKGEPRLQLAKARARLLLGELEAVESFLLGEIELPDLREGETALTDVWFELHARRLAEMEGVKPTEEHRLRAEELHPPPARIDYRMG